MWPNWVKRKKKSYGDPQTHLEVHLQGTIDGV